MATAKAERMTRILSIGAIVISLISLGLSSRIYFLSHRPYLGISDIKEFYENGGSSPIRRIRWAITIKNTGSLPATGRVVKRKVAVHYGKETFDVPLIQVQDASLFIMPGGQGILYGDVPENNHVPLSFILAGKADITDSIRISYEPSKAAWWRSTYFYEAKLQYLGGTGPRYFSFSVVDAD
jgi:hypothetical protein